MKNQSPVWDEYDKRVRTGCLGVIGVIIVLAILILYGIWVVLFLFLAVVILANVVGRLKKNKK